MKVKMLHKCPACGHKFGPRMGDDVFDNLPKNQQVNISFDPPSKLGSKEIQAWIYTNVEAVIVRRRR